MPVIESGHMPSINIPEVVLSEAGRIAYEEDEEGFPFEEAFYVCDLNIVKERFELWNQQLPLVAPHYAVKCNPDLTLLATLAKLGTSFDCASKQEIDMVLKLGVNPDKVLFAHPCKPVSHLRYAKSLQVKRMTFDSSSELLKIHEWYPSAQLVLRIVADDSESLCPFSSKFGANLQKAYDLLSEARKLDLNVIGISFHVGSGCKDPLAYQQAIQDAKSLFEFAEDLGMKLSLLDVGGGFPGYDDSNSPSFPEIAEIIRTSIQDQFANTDVTLIAEPGRFFATSPFTLITRVCSVKNTNYYLNDGLYGSFNCILFDHAQPSFKAYRPTEWGLKKMSRASVLQGSLWGPTCDAIDIIYKDHPLPVLQMNDLLFFPNMGAYTCAAVTGFNGYPKPSIHYLPML